MLTKPVTTIINTKLKKAGRTERLVRGAGYYYVTGVAVTSSLYVCWLERTNADLKLALEHVEEVLTNEDGKAFQF